MIRATTPSAPPFPRRISSAPLTTEQRLLDIEQMRERVNSFVEFMCRPDGLKGTSQEEREKAIAAFHERMAVLERELGRIHDEFRLG